jgi:hypothetical protein
MRVKKTTNRRGAYSDIKWIWSWEGLEHFRDQIHTIAFKSRDADALVREKYPSSVATGLICQAINTLGSTGDPVVQAAADAQRELQALHHKLVWKHHLEFDFVRKEWATILDPSPEQQELCERLARKPN